MESGKNQRDWRTLRYGAWILGAGLWLFLILALMSHDSADWPSHAVAPHYVSLQNWTGRIGAMLSYKLFLMMGPGIWIVMAACLTALIICVKGRPISQPLLRTYGVVLMAVTTSTLFGLSLPDVGINPQGSGGLVALFINDQLVRRFSTVGTTVILTVGFWLGMILAMDRIVSVTGRYVGVSLLTLLQWRLPRLTALRGWSVVAANFPTTDTPQVSHRGGGDDLNDAVLDEIGDAEDEHSEQDAPEAHIQQKKFDPKTLRAKIKNLPINVARTPAVAPPPRREVDLSGYRFPSLDLLTEPIGDFTQEQEKFVREQAVQLESALREYRIEGEVVGIDSGPVISLYEIRLAPGTKVSQVSAISSDLARALRAQNIRIVPNMVGKDTVGIEVPNLEKEKVRLKELMTINSDAATQMKLPMYLAKDASGNPLISDLATMPHMLIAGTTGSGKSVCINSVIMSFLYTKRPDELKLVLVDPKMVEMSMFKAIPHLMCPVVTEMGRATAILEWAVTKMDERYELLAEAGVRDITTYNSLSPDDLITRFDPASEAEAAKIPKKMPYIVFIIDELADLIITNNEVEHFIVRLAQKARAVGIHLIVATQRPQANVVTGLIKSNMPCRVSFKVASGMDSRIVLDQKGAELLLGQGDMLFLSPSTSKLTRAQGTLVADVEVRRVVRFLKEIAEQSFEPQLMQLKGPTAQDVDEMDRDPLFEDAVQIALESRRGSVSLLQRRLTVGYSRASRLIEQMADAGIIGEYKGSQAREVLLTVEEWAALRAQLESEAGSDKTDEAIEFIDDATEEEDSLEGEEEADDKEEDEPEMEDEVDVDEGEKDPEQGEEEEGAESDGEYR